MKGSRLSNGLRLVAGFLTDLRRRRYSPNTILVYGVALRDFFRFLESQHIRFVRVVTVEHLVEYRIHLFDRDLRPSTVDLFCRTVRCFFVHLRAKKLIPSNPAEAVPRIRFMRRFMPVPTDSDMRTLLCVPDTDIPLGIRDRAILETAYSTALRLRELTGIHLADLDLRNNTLRVLGKGNQERVVPLGRQAVLWITRYIEHSRPHLAGKKTGHDLWFGERHHPLDYAGMRSVFRKYAASKGLSCRVTPHSFRRACATAMLRNGAHPLQIKDLLGHRSMGSLACYLRVAVVDLKNTHARSRLGT